MLVEDDIGLWAVAESAEPDLDDDQLWCIDWRNDDDQAGSLLLPEGHQLPVRRLDEADELETASLRGWR